MAFDRVLAQIECRRDPRVAKSLRDQGQHASFPVGQSARPARRRIGPVLAGRQPGGTFERAPVSVRKGRDREVGPAFQAALQESRRKSPDFLDGRPRLLQRGILGQTCRHEEVIAGELAIPMVMATQSKPEASRAVGRSGSSLGQLIRRPEAGSFLGMVAVFVFFAVVAGGAFLSAAGISSWLNVAAEVGIVALPIGLLMIAGELDMSIGAVIPASSLCVAITAGHFGAPEVVEIALALGIGLLVGFVNGLLVLRTGVPSLIVTIGTMFAVMGLPAMAALAALHDGLSDAQVGRPPYAYALVRIAEGRSARLWEGIVSTARILILGVVVDAIYQGIVLHSFYPAQAAVIAILLAFVPYAILRGPIARLARLWITPSAPV